MTAINITHLDTDKLHPLYCKYEQELQEQPAFIELDIRDGSLIADWDAETGNGAAPDLWHGLRRQYGISSNLTTDEINALLTEVAPIAQRIVDEIKIQSDGLQDRPVLSDKAESAEEDMTNACRFASTKSSGIYDADDWFEGNTVEDITAKTTDEELLAMANEYRSNASFEGATVDGVDEHLTDLRDELKEED